MRYLTVSIAILLAGFAAASARGNPGITVDIRQNAQLVDGGHSMLVEAAVTCDAPGSVLEAFIQVTQRHQTIFGQGSIPSVVCDGTRRDSQVRIQALDRAFQHGRARASAFILVCDEQSNCQQGQAVEELFVRP